MSDIAAFLARPDCPEAVREYETHIVHDDCSIEFDSYLLPIDVVHLADAMRDALIAMVEDAEVELEAVLSYDGIMRQIDTWYPLDMPYFRDSDDPGCVSIRLARQVMLATARAEESESDNKRLREEVEACHAELTLYRSSDDPVGTVSDGTNA